MMNEPLTPLNNTDHLYYKVRAYTIEVIEMNNLFRAWSEHRISFKVISSHKSHFKNDHIFIIEFN